MLYNLNVFLHDVITSYSIHYTKLYDISLSELVVKHTPIQNSIQNSAAAISIIGEKEINQNDGVILTSVLNKIPGVYMQQGALNTNRITIRGIGARTQYGTSRVKAYFDVITSYSIHYTKLYEIQKLQ